VRLLSYSASENVKFAEDEFLDLGVLSLVKSRSDLFYGVLFFVSSVGINKDRWLLCRCIFAPLGLATKCGTYFLNAQWATIRGLQALSVQFRFAFSKPYSSQTRFLNRPVAAPAEVAHFCRNQKNYFSANLRFEEWIL